MTVDRHTEEMFELHAPSATDAVQSIMREQERRIEQLEAEIEHLKFYISELEHTVNDLQIQLDMEFDT